MKYPRTLLITASTFNPYTGTGIMLMNLFKGWPIKKIAMVHSDTFYNDHTVCNNSFKMTAREYGFVWPFFERINKATFAGRIGKSNGKSSNILSERDRNFKPNKAIIRKTYEKANEILGGKEVYLKYIVSNRLLQWINQFSPEILYCHISSLMSLRFIRELKYILKIPLCVHIMDDWLNVRYRKGIFGSCLKSTFNKEFEALLAETYLRMGISRKMCDAYEKTFGYSFQPFFNAVDPVLWLEQNATRQEKNGIFRIVYAGTINTKNIRNIESISKVVQQLYKENMNCQFRIYTFQPRVDIYRSKLEKKPCVKIGEVPKRDEDMASLLVNADLLFLPVDFTKISIERMRYSMFAKIPAYMMSGTPILVYGPPEVASVEYAIKEKWAYIVGKEGKNFLKKAIMELIENPDLRARLGKRAQEIGVRDFDANKLRPEFHKALAMAARQSN